MMCLVRHKPFGTCHTFRTQWTHQSHILSEGQGPASVLPSPAACQHNHPSPKDCGLFCGNLSTFLLSVLLFFCSQAVILKLSH